MIIVCGKKRIGEGRVVVIQDEDPSGHHVLMIDGVMWWNPDVGEGVEHVYYWSAVMN